MSRVLHKYRIALGPGHTPEQPVIQLIDTRGNVKHALNEGYALTEDEIELPEPLTRLELEMHIRHHFKGDT